MISETKLLSTVEALLGKIPRNLNAESVVRQLNTLSENSNVPLSEYGYVMWALEHAGMAGIYRGQLSDPYLMRGYADEAKKYKDDMPSLLVNAGEYVEKVFSVMQEPDLCMERLAGMSFPYVLFVLFAAQGHSDVVDRYKTETEELLKRYPGTLDKLPEHFRDTTKEALNADTE